MLITAIAESIVKLEEVDGVLLGLLRESGDKCWLDWSDRVEVLCERLLTELAIRETVALRTLKENVQSTVMK